MNPELSGEADLEKLFLSDAQLLDVRAPTEFADGSVPGSQNIPLLEDEERHQIGLCYKQQGQAAAVELGLRLVSGKAREERLVRWVSFVKEHPDGALYCFRGGLRSQFVQQWLGEAGQHYPRIAGGYKAVRQFLVKSLQQICHKQSFLVLGGRTGCGKTRLLSVLRVGFVDLEALANHRGSAFGGLSQPQPTSIDFENHLSVQLLRLCHHFKTPRSSVVLEDEGRLIGRVCLPPVVFDTISSSPLIVLESSLEERIDHVLAEYVLEPLAAMSKNNAEATFVTLKTTLLGNLVKIRKKLGGARIAEISAQITQAFCDHQATGSSLPHRGWISRLLTEYYDPLYDHHIKQSAHRIVFRGTGEEVRGFLQKS